MIDWLCEVVLYYESFGIEIQKESDRPVILENCAVKKVI